MKYLIFKSVRGLERPWLVFSPSDRRAPQEYMWNDGFATWREALDAVLDSCKGIQA